MAATTICSDFGAPQNKVCHCFHCFPIYFPWSDRTRQWTQYSLKDLYEGIWKRVALCKNLPANAQDIRDSGSIPGSGRSPGEGNGNRLQCSCLENPRDGGAWWAAVSGVTQSRTHWSDLAAAAEQPSAHLRVYITISLCCTAKTNATLQINYTPIRIN